VDEQWGGWSYAAYMASAQNVIYALIDPRGSGFQVKHPELYTTKIVFVLSLKYSRRSCMFPLIFVRKKVKKSFNTVIR
jgi:hypothetical protein